MKAKPESVRAAHILQKHTESRNPNDSYRNKPITRSKAQAMKNILQIQKGLIDGKLKFDQVAADVSECRSAAKGGDLGFFSSGQMQKAFEDAAFALDVGEMSGVVDTDSGLHLILRIE